MNREKQIITVGTRSSKLAIVQTKQALQKITDRLPDLAFAIEKMSSPGDVDHKTALEGAESDFFTRFLDDAVMGGRVDCALHSAKDMPTPVPAQLDWFWLPWREDPRDVIVLREGEKIESLPIRPVAGISSDRRADYCKKRFPTAVNKSIRGNIEERLVQLDHGQFDLLIMASAALKRLNIVRRITEYIPLDELQPPEGQGYLAMTFRVGDKRFQVLRSLWIKSVDFVGAGPGHPEFCTIAGVNALKNCNICFYDALIPLGLLDHLPADARKIDVGKRSGRYKVARDELDEMILNYARQGKKIVRLKGGDPGIFGRLAEETKSLDAVNLPYTVIPGISSLTAATTCSGMLLTRRGLSRGFTVITPRLAAGGTDRIDGAARQNLPITFFMAVGKIREIVTQLTEDGRLATTPAAMVFGAGLPDQEIISGSLGDITERVENFPTTLPGLLIVGEIADSSFLFPQNSSALEKKRILLTASASLQDAMTREIADYGGIPINYPLIKLTLNPDAGNDVSRIYDFDWVTLTSPATVSCLMSLVNILKIDLRAIPRIIVSGSGVATSLAAFGLIPDIMPNDQFSGESMIREAAKGVKAGEKVLRLRSELASEKVARAMEELGADVTDCILYHNAPIHHETLPPFEVVFFASGSAVDAFDENWGLHTLNGKVILVFGEPTAAALAGKNCRATLIAPRSTPHDAVECLAAYYVGQKLAILG